MYMVLIMYGRLKHSSVVVPEISSYEDEIAIE
jgi:hypothetical protein